MRSRSHTRPCPPGLVLGGTLLALLPACSGGGIVPPEEVVDQQLANLGLAVAGLTQDQSDAFDRGKVLMSKEFLPSDGLGPFYNSQSCVACHETPVVGGSAPNYRNFYLVGIGLPGFQGPIADPALPSMVLPSFGEIDGERPRIPDPVEIGDTVTVTQRNAPPFFGVGLFEFVSDDTIIAGSDPFDADGDGISGRYSFNDTGAIGRFGYKLQANNIEAFIRGAANNQMGMTTDPVDGNDAIVSLSSCWLPQIGGDQDSPITDGDAIPDPEISVQDFSDIIAFNRFLAPPLKKPFDEDATAGEVLFDSIGCTKCHVPTIESSMGTLEAYTDLLLHDMGPELADGISLGFVQPGDGNFTSESEFRTQPLWGVALHGPFLHDGRAGTLEEAILAHGGEAEAIRDDYADLSDEEKAQIIAFLEAL